MNRILLFILVLLVGPFWLLMCVGFPKFNLLMITLLGLGLLLPGFLKMKQLIYSRINKYIIRTYIVLGVFFCFIGISSNQLQIQNSIAEAKSSNELQSLQQKNKKLKPKINVNDANKFTAKVLSNHDGDTITVSINGTKEKVRLLGIDTAEMQQGYWGEAAKKFTESFVKGKTVEPETDIQKRDQYGRLLAYVYVSGKFLNNELVKQGYAQLLTYSPNVKYVDLFTKSQKEARSKKLNIWSDKGSTESPHDFRHHKTKSVRTSKSSTIGNKSSASHDTNLVHINVKSGIYNYAGCQYYDCHNCTLEISSSEAEKRGYRHCRKE